MFRRLVFWILILFRICVLGFGILTPYPEKSRFFLNQLALTFKLPLGNHHIMLTASALDGT